MGTLQEKIDELTRHIGELAAQQTHLGKQLLALMNELDELKRQVGKQPVTEKQSIPEKVIEYTETVTAPSRKPVAAVVQTAVPVSHKNSRSFEEFIGKNIASKVGILVTIVGIFIGARYAIEHNLVSPVVRIVNGYLCGLALVLVALKLKKKYETYSSVLMGGGLCVLYFITYIAWSFYGMLPQMAAFGLMLLFTVAIVYVAIWYNQVIIAHLAQVGAYAIPFLLSNNSGRFKILFSYMLIINAGILVLSFYKYWKTLFYVAYIATWGIYGIWYLSDYNGQHFPLAVGFLAAFYILFYATFLAYKLIKKEQYNIGDVFLLLTNAFIFYGLGYSLLNSYTDTRYWPGIFTVANALVHLTVSIIIRRLKLADKSLYYLVLGLVVVFGTIAIPVQLDGNWVTLLWASEAVLLFAIGRTRQTELYEKLAIGLVILAFASLIQDRTQWLYESNHDSPFMNMVFFTGLFVMLSFGVITWMTCQKKWKVLPENRTGPNAFFDYVVPVLLLLTSYYIPCLEVRDAIWKWENGWPAGLSGTIWVEEGEALVLALLFLYAEVFCATVLFLNQHWIKNRWLATASLVGISLLCGYLLVAALPSLNELNIDYFKQASTPMGAWPIVIRYAAITLLAWIITMGSRIVRLYTVDTIMQQAWRLLIYITVLGIISYEYINWTSIAGAQDQFKVGLSIIWGLYALGLVVYGISRKQKYLRLAAIVLFVITILKLFVFDLAEAGNITKTVSFITLGVILLLVSYLYNRYKDVL